jgi:hypothetical protein
VYEPKSDYKVHKEVIASFEFGQIKKIISDNNLEYGGMVPYLDYREVRTLFALVTNGKEISDYWTMTENLWNNRELISVNLSTRKMRILAEMNKLRVNYIKKGQGSCAGNKRHDDFMPHRKCNRDIQNIEPWRLSVSICLGNICQYETLSFTTNTIIFQFRCSTVTMARTVKTRRIELKLKIKKQALTLYPI